MAIRVNRSGSASYYQERSDLETSMRRSWQATLARSRGGIHMAAKYVDYYTSVADRMLPFLQGRQVAIEQRFPRSKGIVYRRHTGGSGYDTWIRIEDRDALLNWA